MKIAIPLAGGNLSMHFGHCDSFVLMDVDVDGKQILSKQELPSPPHQPGLLPQWLSDLGANVIIAGGMGQRAQSLFTQQGIQVLVGASCDTPENLATAFLAGTLQTGENVCDH